jgi:hypothetical protein
MRNIYLLLILLIFISCTAEISIDQELPDDRSFFMGFTAFPYALTQQALDETYESVAKDGDIYLLHLDAGVPWEEALLGINFPENITKTLQEALDAKGNNQMLFVTATPTSQTRNTLALYWNEIGEHQPLPAFWKGKRFNDPDVISAYTNYCKQIIDYTQPDYFAYGIEVNNSFDKNGDDYESFLDLAESVYETLKVSYPTLPIMLTLQGDSFEIPKGDLMQISRDLLEFSDFVAMSTYPFLTSQDFNRDANPALFTNDWLKEFRDLAPKKPFAVSETAFIAEDLELQSVNIKARANEEWQKDYLQKLLIHVNNLDAEFVCWFVYRDYDQIYDLAPSDAFRIWRDTGLKDEDGKERVSYGLWKEWMRVLKN